MIGSEDFSDQIETKFMAKEDTEAVKPVDQSDILMDQEIGLEYSKSKNLNDTQKDSGFDGISQDLDEQLKPNQPALKDNENQP